MYRSLVIQFPVILIECSSSASVVSSIFLIFTHLARLFEKISLANRYFSAIAASGGTVQQVLASRPDAEKNTAARRGGARKDRGEGGRGEIDEEKEDANWSGLVASNSAC